MTIGERIKRIRTLRGMTQKDLGKALGFPERSADVRVAQYETGSRTPKEDVVKAMADVLNVSPRAIADPDWNTYIGLMYMLFDLEETYGIRVDQIDGEICLRMDRFRKDYVEIYDMILKWYEARKAGQADFDAGAAYEEWKLHYPPAIR